MTINEMNELQRRPGRVVRGDQDSTPMTTQWVVRHPQRRKFTRCAPSSYTLLKNGLLGPGCIGHCPLCRSTLR